MKLVHPHISVFIDFSLSDNYQLVIESPTEFFGKITELYNQINGGEGNFVLSDSNEIIDISKNIVIITDYIDFSLNTKKNLSEVNSIMLSNLKKNDFSEELSKINSQIFNLNDALADLSMLPVEYNELTNETLVKLSSYYFDDSLSLPQKISTYAKLLCYNKKTKVMVFVNLPDFLSMEDINLLIKDINYNSLKILFINSHLYDIKSVKNIIVDKDLCVI